MTPPIRLCEWGHTTKHGLNMEEREAVTEAAMRWQQDNRLPLPPLYFTGANGERLCARQYVGVVEALGRTIEIYPKLDAHLLDRDTIDEAAPLNTVMQSVLWMLEVAEAGDVPEAGTTALGELPTDFIDLFALLLAKNLRVELVQGVARQYERQTDDLKVVRGRIDVVAQIIRNANRMDRLACVWDEFTPNTPMNRLFRCACRTLVTRVRHNNTAWLLQDCLALLEDVDDTSAPAALQEVRHLHHWDRSRERFRRPFELAHRLLSGFGHALEAAHADTFVFLIDMNKLFESYVHAVLSSHFNCSVQAQHFMGKLLTLDAGGIYQYADFFLRDTAGMVWIGDAKYKHLTRGHNNAASFTNILAPSDADEDTRLTLAQKRVSLSPDDVRQLTVYAELEARRSGDSAPTAHLLLLYPFVGSGTFTADTATAWNGSRLYLVPVRVHPPIASQPMLLPPLPS